jgi:hypothetical protein
VLWVLALAFRDTATMWAAREAARTGEIPGWLEPLQESTGLMFWIYMVAGYALVAFYGWGIIKTQVVAHGVGWFVVVFGYVLGTSFVARFPRTLWGPVAEVPALIHIPTLAFGIALLART